MLMGLATGNAIALAAMAAIFIGFALVSAFVIPRRSPNFPGRRLGWYVFGTVVLFLAMISTVLVFGKEEKEAEGATGETPPAETSTGETTTGETSTGGAPAGDAAAGKQVFATAGCGGCHTLKAAGSSGNVGPNLDDVKPDEALIKDRVENGKPPMPAFGKSGQLTQKQIDDVVAFVYTSTH
jgi:mono/diheme cytochrome c family protein